MNASPGYDLVEYKAFELAVRSKEYRRIRLADLAKQCRYGAYAVAVGGLASVLSVYIAVTRNDYFWIFGFVNSFLAMRGVLRAARGDAELKLLQMLEIQEAISVSQKSNQ